MTQKVVDFSTAVPLSPRVALVYRKSSVHSCVPAKLRRHRTTHNRRREARASVQIICHGAWRVLRAGLAAGDEIGEGPFEWTDGTVDPVWRGRVDYRVDATGAPATPLPVGARLGALLVSGAV